jgi:hypothetical protein
VRRAQLVHRRCALEMVAHGGNSGQRAVELVVMATAVKNGSGRRRKMRRKKEKKRSNAVSKYVYVHQLPCH